MAAGFGRWFAEDKRAVTRIRLAPELAEQLKRDWFYRHARFEDDRGSVIMAVPETDARSILPLVRWLGPDAELLSPEPLRRRMAEDARRLARRYPA